MLLHFASRLTNKKKLGKIMSVEVINPTELCDYYATKKI